MHCAKCGRKVSTFAKFCPKCGGKIFGEKLSFLGGGNKTPRHRWLKILGIFVAILAVLIIIPAIGYVFTAYGSANYKHPYAGFTFKYFKSLKMETPALPPDTTCKTAAPCLVTFKNSYYDDYVVNWLIVMSATDAGVDKETFINGAIKGFQSDVDAGIATATTIGGKTIYKYENNPGPAANTIAVFSKMMNFDPLLEKTMHVFISGDSIVVVFFRKSPPGAPGIYTNYLDISSLIIP